MWSLRDIKSYNAEETAERNKIREDGYEDVFLDLVFNDYPWRVYLLIDWLTERGYDQLAERWRDMERLGKLECRNEQNK